MSIYLAGYQSVNDSIYLYHALTRPSYSNPTTFITIIDLSENISPLIRSTNQVTIFLFIPFSFYSRIRSYHDWKRSSGACALVPSPTLLCPSPFLTLSLSSSPSILFLFFLLSFLIPYFVLFWHVPLNASLHCLIFSIDSKLLCMSYSTVL